MTSAFFFQVISIFFLSIGTMLQYSLCKYTVCILNALKVQKLPCLSMHLTAQLRSQLFIAAFLTLAQPTNLSLFILIFFYLLYFCALWSMDPPPSLLLCSCLPWACNNYYCNIFLILNNIYIYILYIQV